jgi:hypothetical protein
MLQVRPGMAVDREAVARHLGLEESGVRIKQFQHGQSNPTYLVQAQG